MWPPQMEMFFWLRIIVSYRKKGNNRKVCPQDKQDGDEWVVLKRYECSNVYLVVQKIAHYQNNSFTKMG